MSNFFLDSRFALLAATNFCLFLIVSTWNLLPVFIVKLGGTNLDVGLVMGSIGVTSLGSLPFIAPLMDRYGRKLFISIGILLAGATNVFFLFFPSYSPAMILIRLIQGVAFAACFTGCATSVVDIIPPEKRAQGIGLFGVSGSLAVAVGPYIGEKLLLNLGYQAYFELLVVFGLIGFAASFPVTDAKRPMAPKNAMRGFFSTAMMDKHITMMCLAATFGSAFAAMSTYFPLYAGSLEMAAGPFFVCYGITLVVVRVLLGALTDRVKRSQLILASLVGFSFLLACTSSLSSSTETLFLGSVFGILQGLSYPAMMARMVDRSTAQNRAVVVALFTGSFGVGMNLASLLWGFLANLSSLRLMYLTAAAFLLFSSLLYGAIARPFSRA
jgi:MFS family permease